MTTRTVVYSTETGRVAQAHQAKKTRAPIVAGGGVLVRREKKGRGGKEVTVVLGLSSNQHDIKSLAKQLKTRIGTGGSIKNGTIEIQGDHRDKVISLLADSGIKAKRGGG